MQEDNHLSYDFIYINHLPFWTTLLEEQPDSLDDFRRASSVFYDSHGSCARLFEIWCVGGKPAHTGIGVGDGGGNRLIHFVRQRSSHLSHGGHPVHVREICLGLTQSFALFTRQLAFNGNAGEVDGHFEGAGFSGARTARFSVIHSKRTQHLARMRKYGSGPTSAEPIRLSHFSVRLPERVLENVGDDHRFSAEHGGTA